MTVPTGKPDFRTNNFDLLRLLAATEVVFDHYFQHLNIPLTAFQSNILYLFPGVPVFFMISGYLISASYERNADLKKYSRNRVLRIYPGLWGCILLTIVVISITGVNFINTQTLAWLPSQLVGFIYTPGFLSNYGFGSYNGALWTIPIELQFYIVLPLLYLFIPRQWLNRALLVLLAVFVLVTIVFQQVQLSPKIEKLAGYTFMPHFYLFLLGVILQRLQLFKSKIIFGKALSWLAIYLSFCLGAYKFMSPLAFELLRNVLLGFVVLALAYSWPQTAKKLLHGNDISYGVYMYHGLVLTVMVQYKYNNSFTLPFLLLLTFVLATASWLFIERPFIKMKSMAIKDSSYMNRK